MTRWDHLLAISFVGVGALVLTVIGDLRDAMFLYGALAAYGLKNGVALATNGQPQATKAVSASTVNSTLSTTDSTVNDSLEDSSLLELADEGYEATVG